MTLIYPQFQKLNKTHREEFTNITNDDPHHRFSIFSLLLAYCAIIIEIFIEFLIFFNIPLVITSDAVASTAFIAARLCEITFHAKSICFDIIIEPF